MHVALASVAGSRAILRPAFEYPFADCGKSVILGCVPASNARSVHLAERLGFRVTHRTRDGWAPGVDLVGLEMRREECRWLEAERKAA
jgi:RimJ/RimL family protein N-acetyltransferase